MFDRRIATCDRENYKKRLSEFMNVAQEFMKNDLNEHNIFQVLYKTELFRNSIYKCIKLKLPMMQDCPLPGKESGISEFEDEYSDGILKIKIHELLPPVRTPYNNKRLENTCQFIAEKYSNLFKDKKVIIRVQVGVPRDNWDIDNRDLRYIFNGFVYGKLITDDNINFVSYMLEGIKARENFIKIFISEKDNIQEICAINPDKYFEKKCDFYGV